MAPRTAGQPRAAAVVLAAGSGSRVGSVHNKVFLHLAGRRVVSWSLQSLARVGSIERFIMVIRESDRQLAEETIDRELEDLDVEIVLGGDSRHESELLALRHLAPAITRSEIDIVLIHDGARPLLSPTLVRSLIGAAAEHGAAFPGLHTDEIRRLRPDGTVDFSHVQTMVRAQTPQAFGAHALLNAYERASAEGFIGTDTASCVQHYSDTRVQQVPGDPRNIKITYPNDLFEAETILRHEHFHLD